MNYLLKFLKGIAIGIANVIPGFSGATMAIIVKIYDEFIDAFSSILRHPIQVIKKSWSLFIGVVLGVLLALFGIVKLLETATLPAVLFFTGLIIGSLPSMVKNVKLKPVRVANIISFIVCLALVIGLPFIGKHNIDAISAKNIGTLIVIAIMGIASAAAMVIPGISGSMVLMIFGYYTIIMSSAKGFLQDIVHFDFANNFLRNLVICLAFGAGVIIGLVAISKLIKVAYQKYPVVVWFGVIGLILASPFAILYSSNLQYPGMYSVKWYIWIIAIISLVVGALFAYFMNRIGDKRAIVQQEESK